MLFLLFLMVLAVVLELLVWLWKVVRKPTLEAASRTTRAVFALLGKLSYATLYLIPVAGAWVFWMHFHPGSFHFMKDGDVSFVVPKAGESFNARANFPMLGVVDTPWSEAGVPFERRETLAYSVCSSKEVGTLDCQYVDPDMLSKGLPATMKQAVESGMCQQMSLRNPEIDSWTARRLTFDYIPATRTCQVKNLNETQAYFFDYHKQAFGFILLGCITSVLVLLYKRRALKKVLP